ncbi:hypothetical protein IE53DRAFT_375503 [Violaceomyces palustris]|uniref:Uncharacterized protein n=1 Tax=Violaceomyces palustris TaxID=1673888 RepID=A0ACD0NS10_9BASI|nr:hypothetical protein IE53DRAFT_375503 [Violaceomyces palustris]
MSTLPEATSQISENPAKNTVTHATDPKQKKEDVDRKMRFFGVIQAFREGRYPDNKQIDDTLKYTLATSPVDVDQLSPDGQKLVQDVRELIETARQIVLEKNQNEEFQNFLFASRKADVKSSISVKSPITKDEAQKDGETAGEAFRTLVTLFLKNGELRKLFQDLGYVARDIFADGAAKASEIARPEEEKLNQVGQPGPENEFHDDIPGALKKKQAEQKLEPAKEEAKEHANDLVNSVDPNASHEENKAAAAETVKAKANLLAERIPQKHKDLAKEHIDKTRVYAKEKFPKERREQFIYRLKKVVVECQRHHDYQDAMDYFLNAFEQYKGHAGHLHDQVVGNAGQVRSDGNVSTVETTFRRLIERFANGRPTQPMLDALDQIYVDVKNDSELRDWFSHLNMYIRQCLQEPGFIMKDEANTQGIQLIDSGKKFFVATGDREQGKYAAHKDKLFKEVEFFFKGVAEDPLNKRFGEDWKRLVQDLFTDADGKPTFKPHLWNDIRDPILPQLLNRVVPVPRIEFTDKMVDLVIENLTIEGQNLMPNILEVEARNYFKLSQYKKLGDVHQHSFKIHLAQIQSDMRDIAFSFRKKTGFPKLNEHGIADVFLGGKGLSITIHLEAENAPRGKKSNHIFKLNFAIRGSKHDTLIKILRPMATSLIKKQICKAAEQGIRGGLEDLDSQLVELRDRMEANKNDKDKTITDALKETFIKSDKGSSDKENKGSFKFTTSKRSSILPDLGNPEGWVNKIDESKPDWHSPAFSIVSENQKNPNNTESAKVIAKDASATTPASGAEAIAAGSGAGANRVEVNGTAGNAAAAAPAIPGATIEEEAQPLNSAANLPRTTFSGTGGTMIPGLLATKAA